MNYSDFMKELRKGQPDPEKTSRALKKIGWICCGVGVWDFIVFLIVPFVKVFNIPQSYPWVCLIAFLFVGMLFFISSHGVKEMEPRGKKAGQIAIILLFGSIVYLTFGIFYELIFIGKDRIFSIIFLISSFLGVAQVAIPAYYGIRYLQRLPTSETISRAGLYKKKMETMAAEQSRKFWRPRKTTYHESLFPINPYITVFLMVVLTVLGIFMLVGDFGWDGAGGIILVFVLLMFVGPIIYNSIPSSFQRKRHVIALYRGGGSACLLNATWPFFRVIVYEDGIEIRFVYQRYFIPYDKLGDLPDKIRFFNNSVLIKSDLPDVPSEIMFSGFGMNKFLKQVNEMKNKYISTHQPDAQQKRINDLKLSGQYEDSKNRVARGNYRAYVVIALITIFVVLIFSFVFIPQIFGPGQQITESRSATSFKEEELLCRFRKPEHRDMSAGQLHSEGIKAFNDNNYELAIALWLIELEKDPQNSNTMNNIGIGFSRLEQWKTAEYWARTAIKRDANFGHAHVSLGIALNGLGRYAEAEQEIVDGIRLGYENAAAHMNLGYSYHMQGKKSLAEQEFQLVEKKYPNFPRLKALLKEYGYRK